MAKLLCCIRFGLLFVLSYFSSGEICISSVCEFTLEIRWGRTMTYRPPDKNNAYNLDLDGDRLRIVNSSFFQEWDDAVGRYVDDLTPDVITADGVKRNVIVINGQFPGPTLEVAEGSQILVHVKNELFKEGITIHWHGLSQLYTPWMDGAAYVSQCSIEPRQSFTYRFLAQPSGTHWYHSHLHNQRMDGLYGALIIHKSIPTTPHIPFLVTDWFHEQATTLEIMNPFSLSREDKGSGDMIGNAHNKHYSVDGHELTSVLYTSGLINGRGRFDERKLPLATFNVKNGKRSRFRMVNTAAEYAFEISIDDHVLWVVASDGSDIEPIEVTSVIMNPGETIDFEIQANQTPGHYWIRARIPSAGTAVGGTVFGDRPTPQGDDIKEVKAILRYEGVTVEGDPETNRYSCISTFKCRIFNCPFPAYPIKHYKTCISMARVSSSNEHLTKNKMEFGLDDHHFEEHFFNVGFNWGSSINGNKFVYPTEPFSQTKTISPEVSCDRQSCAAPDVGCVCTNIMDIPFNKTMQFVITNFEPNIGGAFVYMGPHSIHLHGHNFAVLKMGFAEYNKTSALFTDHNPDIVCANRLCKSPRWNGQPPNDLNLENPPIKNTIIVPAKGYVVVRFKSNNPGYWPMHCHAVTHHSEGMNMVFREAADRISPVPEQFPTCKFFDWSQEAFEDYLIESKRLVQGDSAGDNYNKGVGDTKDSEENFTQDEILKPCSPQKDNQITMDVGAAIGFGVGFIAFGAMLVLLSFYMYSNCHGSKVTAKNESN